MARQAFSLPQVSFMFEFFYICSIIIFIKEGNLWLGIYTQVSLTIFTFKSTYLYMSVNFRTGLRELNLRL